MQMRAVLGRALSAPSLGTTGWSVKEYTVGGKKVWASYQSPATNTAIVELQKNLVKMGLPSNTDGLIGAQTVAAFNELVRAAGFIPNDRLTSGQTVSEVISHIRTAGGSPFTAQKIAQNGASIRVAVLSLVSHGWFVNTVKNIVSRTGAASAPSSSPTSTSTPTPSAPVMLPPLPPADAAALVAAGGPDNRSFFTKHPNAKYYVGGGVVFAGLLATTLWLWFAPVRAGDFRDP